MTKLTLKRIAKKFEKHGYALERRAAGSFVQNPETGFVYRYNIAKKDHAPRDGFDRLAEAAEYLDRLEVLATATCQDD